MTRYQELRVRLAFWLSKRLCPEVHQDADRYSRLAGQISMYEQWLGTSHPSAAAVCHQLLKEDYHHWTGEYYDSQPSLWWRPPGYVWGVSEFRNWLNQRPFAGRV